MSHTETPEETMNRRHFTKAVGAATLGISTLAGCVDTDELDGDAEQGNAQGQTTTQPNPDRTGDGTRDIGESVTYGGLKTTVTKARTVTAYTAEDGDHTPEQGATVLLTHIRIKHVGEVKIHFPTSHHIEFLYKTEDTRKESVVGSITVDGETLTTYEDSMDAKQANKGAFPDTTVEGWVVFYVPEGFSKSDAAITIQYDGSADVEKQFKWILG